MVVVGQTIPDDTLRTQIYWSISTIASQLHKISSDRCGRYMLRSRGTIPTAASSSAPVSDDYGVVDIPSPLEVSAILEVDALWHLGSYLAFDLLDAYRALSTVIWIPLRDIPSQIHHILSCTEGSEGSQRQEDIPAPSTAPSATQAQATAPAPTTQDPTAPAPTQDVTTRQPGLFTSMLSDQGRTIDFDGDTIFSLHDLDISQIDRALHNTMVNIFICLNLF